MACAELVGSQGVQRKGQETSRSGDACALYDNGAVVHGRTRAEYRQEQIVAQISIERDAAFNVGPQADVALEGDQGADAVLGKVARRQHHVIKRRGRAIRRETRQRKIPSETIERATDFRLK